MGATRGVERRIRMTKENQNLKVWAGDAEVIEFAITDANGVAVNCTGATFVYGAEFPTEIHKTNADMDLTGIATGIVKVLLTSTDTRQAAGKYEHGLQMTLSGVGPLHVAVGKIELLPEIAD